MIKLVRIPLGHSIFNSDREPWEDVEFRTDRFRLVLYFRLPWDCQHRLSQKLSKVQGVASVDVGPFFVAVDFADWIVDLFDVASECRRIIEKFAKKENLT